MKNSTGAQSATSLPRAPQDEVGARSKRYLITMGIRVACFILMVAIHPYSWYTWIFAAAAVFLPYIAVVMANVGEDGRTPAPENPERSLPAAPTAPVATDAAHPVLRLDEQRPPTSASTADRDADPTA